MLMEPIEEVTAEVADELAGQVRGVACDPFAVQARRLHSRGRRHVMQGRDAARAEPNAFAVHVSAHGR